MGRTMSEAVLRALAASILADARADLARAEARVAQLIAIAEAMSRPVLGDGDQLVNADVAGVDRTTWNAAARSGRLVAKKVCREYRARRVDVAAWLASLDSPPSPRSNFPKRVEANVEPADAFERARLRARDRKVA